MSTTTTTNNDVLADFALQIFERARQLQHERTGLMSNAEARNRACMEYFSKAITNIQNVIAFTKLFDRHASDERIKSMLEFTSSDSNSSEAKSIMERMLDKLGATNNTASAVNSSARADDDSKEPIQKEKEECTAP